MPLTAISSDGYSLCSISGNNVGLTGYSQLYIIPSSARLSITVYATGPTNNGTISGIINYGDGTTYGFSSVNSGGVIQSHQYQYPATYRVSASNFTFSGGPGTTGITNADVTFTEQYPEVFNSSTAQSFYNGATGWSSTDPYAGYNVAKCYVFVPQATTSNTYRNLRNEILGLANASSSWNGGTGVYNYVNTYVRQAFINSKADDLIIHSPFGNLTSTDLDFNARSLVLAAGTGPNGQALSVLCGATGTTYGSSEFIRAWTDFYNVTGVVPWFYLGTFIGTSTAYWKNLYYSSGLSAVRSQILFEAAPILALPKAKIVLDAAIGPARLPPFDKGLSGSFDTAGTESFAWYARKLLIENGASVGNEPRTNYNQPFFYKDPNGVNFEIDSTFVNVIENDPNGWNAYPLVGTNRVLGETAILCYGGARTSNQVDPFRSTSEHNYIVNLLAASNHAYIEHYTAGVYDSTYDVAKGVKISAAIAFAGLTPSTTHFSFRSEAALLNGYGLNSSGGGSQPSNLFNSPHQISSMVSINGKLYTQENYSFLKQVGN